MPNIFHFDSYKTYLRAVLEEKQEKRGFQGQLASAAGCQASYISQVLRGNSELLPDHAAGISEFLELNQTESDFFLSLVLLGRASTRKMKEFLEKKLVQIRNAQSRLDKRIGNETTMSAELEKFYYSSWYWVALHIATSIPELQTAKALAARFNLPLTKILQCLNQLESHGMVCHTKGKWVYAGGAAHLPASSLMTELNHTHWRQKALLDVQRGEESSLHYTSVVSMTKEDAEKMRELLLQCISKSRKISDPSQPEELFAFSLDFYRV